MHYLGKPFDFISITWSEDLRRYADGPMDGLKKNLYKYFASYNRWKPKEIMTTDLYIFHPLL